MKKLFTLHDKTLEKRLHADIYQKIKKRMEKDELYAEELPPFTQRMQIQSLRELADVRAQRSISSHRKLVGPLFVRLRRIIDEEIQRAIEPHLLRQIKFNKKVIDALEKMDKKMQQGKKNA